MIYGNYEIELNRENGLIKADVLNKLTNERTPFTPMEPDYLIQALLNNLTLDKEAEGNLREDIQSYFE